QYVDPERARGGLGHHRVPRRWARRRRARPLSGAARRRDLRGRRGGRRWAGRWRGPPRRHADAVRRRLPPPGDRSPQPGPGRPQGQPEGQGRPHQGARLQQRPRPAGGVVSAPVAAVRGLQSRWDRGVVTTGAMIVLALQSVSAGVSDIVRRRFPWSEFFFQAWFMTRVSLVPTILVAIP